MDNTVEYTKQGIVITILSASPGAAHENLLRGTVAGIKGHLHDGDKTPEDTANVVALVEFLARLLPSEQQLNKSFG